MGSSNDSVGFDSWVPGTNNTSPSLLTMARISSNRGFLFLCFPPGDLSSRTAEDVKTSDSYKYERFRVNFSSILDFRCNIIQKHVYQRANNENLVSWFMNKLSYWITKDVNDNTNNKPSLFMPICVHFTKRQYWQLFLVNLLMTQLPSFLQVYTKFFWTLRLKNPLHPSQEKTE